MYAISTPAQDRSQAEKYFNSIYNHIKDFGGRQKGDDDSPKDYSKAYRSGKFNIVRRDFTSDSAADNDEAGLCKMGLKMDQARDKHYTVSVHII